MDKLAPRTFFHDVNYDAIMSMPVSFIYPVHCSVATFENAAKTKLESSLDALLESSLDA